MAEPDTIEEETDKKTDGTEEPMRYPMFKNCRDFNIKKEK